MIEKIRSVLAGIVVEPTADELNGQLSEEPHYPHVGVTMRRFHLPVHRERQLVQRGNGWRGHIRGHDGAHEKRLIGVVLSIAKLRVGQEAYPKGH